MFGVAPFKYPNECADPQRHPDQAEQRLHEAERDQDAEQTQPIENRFSWYCDPEPGRVIRLTEINGSLTVCGDRDRSNGCVEPACGRAVDQFLKRDLLESVAKMELIGDAAPEINTYSGPGAVTLFHREGRGLLGADDQNVTWHRGRYLCAGRPGRKEGERGKDEPEDRAKTQPGASQEKRLQHFCTAGPFACQVRFPSPLDTKASLSEKPSRCSPLTPKK